MNLNAPKEIFDEIKETYLNLNPLCLDEKIRDVVMRFKDMPFLDKVCPRWSCQGHSDKNTDSSFYIIFATQDDGAEILYHFYELLYKTFSKKYGILYLAGNKLTVMPLMFTSKKDNIERNYTPFPNIQISTNNNGIETHIDKCVDVWNEVLDIMKKEYS